MPPVAVGKEQIIGHSDPLALPKEPELRSLTVDMIAMAKHSFDAVAAHEGDQPTNGRLDDVFTRFLGTRNTTLQTAVRNRMPAELAS
jgi:hypothetical protein